MAEDYTCEAQPVTLASDYSIDEASIAKIKQLQMVQRVSRISKPRPRFIEPLECQSVAKLPVGFPICKTKAGLDSSPGDTLAR